MRLFRGALVIALLFQICALAQPASAPPLTIRPAGKDLRSFTWRGLDLLRTQIARAEIQGELPAEGTWSIPLNEAGLTGHCLATEMPQPLLVCQYGTDAEPTASHALIWRDREAWLVQPYPQVQDPIAAERRRFFTETCPSGCRTRIRQMQAGGFGDSPELLIVLDQGSETVPMEEVHLLRQVDEEWRIAWAPAPGNWNWGHARVTLMQPKLTGFTVRSSSWARQDRHAGYLEEPAAGDHRWFEERWVRKGAAFMLRDQVEEPGPYASLVRLVYYLSHYYDQRAMAFLGPAINVEEARSALAQRPPRQGWRVERAEGPVYRLDRDGDGKSDLEADFAERAGSWVLTGLRDLSASP